MRIFAGLHHCVFYASATIPSSYNFTFMVIISTGDNSLITKVTGISTKESSDMTSQTCTVLFLILDSITSVTKQLRLGSII